MTNLFIFIIYLRISNYNTATGQERMSGSADSTHIKAHYIASQSLQQPWKVHRLG